MAARSATSEMQTVGVHVPPPRWAGVEGALLRLPLGLGLIVMGRMRGSTLRTLAVVTGIGSVLFLDLVGLVGSLGMALASIRLPEERDEAPSEDQPQSSGRS